LAPGAWHSVFTAGALRARTVRIFTLEIDPALLTTTVMTVPALSGLRMNDFRDSGDLALRLVSDLAEQPCLHVTVTVEPFGNDLMTSDDSFVLFAPALKLNPGAA
jgi:hypothetical protein